MFVKQFFVISCRLAVKAYICDKILSSSSFPVCVSGGIIHRNTFLGRAVQPPAVNMASLAGADLLQARPVVLAALAAPVRVVRRRAGEDPAARPPHTPLRSGTGIWYTLRCWNATCGSRL